MFHSHLLIELKIVVKFFKLESIPKLLWEVEISKRTIVYNNIAQILIKGTFIQGKNLQMPTIKGVRTQEKKNPLNFIL